MKSHSFPTIRETKKELYEKKLSSFELVKSLLERIDRADRKLNAFITVCSQKALEQAKKADEKIARGEELPLLGIPLAVKDVYLTNQVRTTAGAKVLADYIPQYSATIVDKLEQAGAVVIGKTNCDAWAHGSSGENSDFGPSKNPWDLTKVPGGSSSGSAVAVSAGFSLAALGTDTGGSVRLPASFTNTVGLKPTYGRVSRFGVIAMASSFDTMGHFTRTVYDSALVLGVTAGKDVNDATTFPNKPPDYLKDIFQKRGEIRIGIPQEFFAEGLDNEIKKTVLEAVSTYKSLGYEIIEVNLPHVEAALAVYYILMASEVSSNLARYDGIRYGNPRDYFNDEAKRRIMLGTYSLSAGYYDAYYLKAQKVRTLVKRDFEEVFKKVDLLIGPVSPVLPFNIGEKVNDPLSMYLADILTVPVSLAGLPALSIPCGFSQDNLPIGFQLIGSQLAEDLLFKAGNAYQEETSWHTYRPKL